MNPRNSTDIPNVKFLKSTPKKWQAQPTLLDSPRIVSLILHELGTPDSLLQAIRSVLSFSPKVNFPTNQLSSCETEPMWCPSCRADVANALNSSMDNRRMLCAQQSNRTAMSLLERYHRSPTTPVNLETERDARESVGASGGQPRIFCYRRRPWRPAAFLFKSEKRATESPVTRPELRFDMPRSTVPRTVGTPILAAANEIRNSASVIPLNGPTGPGLESDRLRSERKSLERLRIEEMAVRQSPTASPSPHDHPNKSTRRHHMIMWFMRCRALASSTSHKFGGNGRPVVCL